MTNKVGLLFRSRRLYTNIHDPLQLRHNKATLQHFQNLNLFSSLLVWFFYLTSPPAFSLPPHPLPSFSLLSLSLVFSRYISFRSGVRGSGIWGVLSSSVPRRTTLLLSPGVRMTGSQSDGTEQVYSMWPPLLRGRMQRGEEDGVKRRRRGSEIKERRRRKKDVWSGDNWASHV